MPPRAEWQQESVRPTDGRSFTINLKCTVLRNNPSLAGISTLAKCDFIADALFSAKPHMDSYLLFHPNTKSERAGEYALERRLEHLVDLYVLGKLKGRNVHIHAMPLERFWEEHGAEHLAAKIDYFNTYNAHGSLLVPFKLDDVSGVPGADSDHLAQVLEDTKLEKTGADTAAENLDPSYHSSGLANSDSDWELLGVDDIADDSMAVKGSKSGKKVSILDGGLR